MNLLVDISLHWTLFTLWVDVRSQSLMGLDLQAISQTLFLKHLWTENILYELCHDWFILKVYVAKKSMKHEQAYKTAENHKHTTKSEGRIKI